jgi:NTP pyrophosphatase (non-canonical NTP hydrolase)
MYNFGVMNIDELTRAMHAFVNKKGWYDPESLRPQTPKNLATSLIIEAAEVLEHFQWDESPPDTAELARELADVMLYLLQLASVLEIDLEQSVMEKLAVNYNREWDQDRKEKTNDNES